MSETTKENGKTVQPARTGNTGIAADQLRSFIERVERLTEEKKALQTDIKEVFAEAKGNGFDTKIMRIVLRSRAMEDAERAEQRSLVEMYESALGMFE